VPVVNINIKDNISVYPNPFVNQIKFDINHTGSDNVIVQIFDITGKKVVERVESTNVNASYSITINLEDHMISGSYFYRISSGNISKTGKLIKVD